MATSAITRNRYAHRQKQILQKEARKIQRSLDEATAVQLSDRQKALDIAVEKLGTAHSIATKSVNLYCWYFAFVLQLY